MLFVEALDQVILEQVRTLCHRSFCDLSGKEQVSKPSNIKSIIRRHRVSTFKLGKDYDYYQQIITRHCVAQWEAGGEKFVNCTKQDMTPRDVIKWAENIDDNDDVVIIMMSWIWSPNYVQNTFWWFFEQILMAVTTPPPLMASYEKFPYFLRSLP